MRSLLDILNDMFSEEYDIEGKIIDSSDLGVPQTRLRAKVISDIEVSQFKFLRLCECSYTAFLLA